ncbi:unnamed protein product, partial [Rotaria sp. Silwood2]
MARSKGQDDEDPWATWFESLETKVEEQSISSLTKILIEPPNS